MTTYEEEGCAWVLHAGIISIQGNRPRCRDCKAITKTKVEHIGQYLLTYVANKEQEIKPQAVLSKTALRGENARSFKEKTKKH